MRWWWTRAELCERWVVTTSSPCLWKPWKLKSDSPHATWSLPSMKTPWIIFLCHRDSWWSSSTTTPPPASISRKCCLPCNSALSYLCYSMKRTLWSQEMHMGSWPPREWLFLTSISTLEAPSLSMMWPSHSSTQMPTRWVWRAWDSMDMGECIFSELLHKCICRILCTMKEPMEIDCRPLSKCLSKQFHPKPIIQVTNIQQ